MKLYQHLQNTHDTQGHAIEELVASCDIEFYYEAQDEPNPNRPPKGAPPTEAVVRPAVKSACKTAAKAEAKATAAAKADAKAAAAKTAALGLPMVGQQVPPAAAKVPHAAAKVPGSRMSSLHAMS